jgi:hypothetical protein
VYEADRDYLHRRFLEVTDIRDRAGLVASELADCLAEPTTTGGIPPMRLARWTEVRRAKLAAWIDERDTQIGHVEVELFVLAFAAPPPVWLVIWCEAPPWWSYTPWRTLAALWTRWATRRTSANTDALDAR